MFNLSRVVPSNEGRVRAVESENAASHSINDGAPSKSEFLTDRFADGDLIYGLSKFRTITITAVKAMPHAETWKCASFIDSYNWWFAGGIQSANLWLAKQLDADPGVDCLGREAARKTHVPTLHLFSNFCADDRLPHWSQYIRTISTSKKYQVPEMLREIVDNYDCADSLYSMYRVENFYYSNHILKRHSKMGLDMAARHQIPLHFVLDGIDVEAVAKKAGESGRSITASELRWARRNWNDLRNVVTFYRNGKVSAAPWEYDNSFDCFYRPVSKSDVE